MKSTSLKLLHQKRKYAVDLYKQGIGIMQIVKQCGLSYPTVRNVIDLYIESGLDGIKPQTRGRRPGSGRSLDKSQEQIIQNIIKTQNPRDYGLDYGVWSRPAVANLIQNELGIVITTRGVGNYLARWGLNGTAKHNRNDDLKPISNKRDDGFTWGPTIKRFGAASQTQAGRTALMLKRDIITNKFHPGERLTFEKLSKLYEVGSSPLREALFKVMGEGLVLSEEHKGFLVAPINTEEMLDISSLRAQLEAQALRLSIQLGDENWEAKVISSNHLLKKATNMVHTSDDPGYQQASETWEVRHRELHTTLCSACNSPWLLYFIGILYEHLERYRRYFWDYTKRAKGADYEHEQIVHAALARDADKAVRLLHEHFKTQAELSMMTAEKVHKN